MRGEEGDGVMRQLEGGDVGEVGVQRWSVQQAAAAEIQGPDIPRHLAHVSNRRGVMTHHLCLGFRV